MKKYETNEVTVKKKKTTLVSMDCDLCKRSFKNEDWNRRDSFAVLETDVSMKTGSRFPEGGFVETTSFDICPSCFEQKLVPWLVEQGATPTVAYSDW